MAWKMTIGWSLGQRQREPSPRVGQSTGSLELVLRDKCWYQDPGDAELETVSSWGMPVTAVSLG